MLYGDVADFRVFWMLAGWKDGPIWYIVSPVWEISSELFENKDSSLSLRDIIWAKLNKHILEHSPVQYRTALHQHALQVPHQAACLSLILIYPIILVG